MGLLLLTVIALALASPAGEKDKPPAKTKMVTITFRKTPFAKALEQLGKHGLNYVCTKEVLESAPPVTARFRDVPLMEAAKAVVKTVGLYYVIESPTKIRIRKSVDP